MRVTHAMGILGRTGVVLTDDMCAWRKQSLEAGTPLPPERP
jgi:hypothetical protein